MRFTLRQLQVFVAVAHHQGVGAAANALAMSQSAVSGALKELESHYDVQLFERVGKRLKISAEGARLWPKAQALLDQAQALDADLTAHASVPSLTLGATLTIGNYLAVEMIERFMREYNGQASLVVGNTQQMVDALLQFDIDLALLEGEVHHPLLQLSHWRQDELICFCSPDNPLAKKHRLNDDDLIAAPWILREQGSGTRQTFDRAMHGLLPDITVKMTLQHTEAIKRAVENNLGVSCLSRIALADNFRHGTLVPLATPTRDFTRELFIAMHQEKYRSLGVEAWLALCSNEQHLKEI